MPTIKPTIPEINWRNPITKGLVFDAPLFEGGGLRTLDIASKVKGVISGAPAWVRGPWGWELKFTAASNHLVTFTTIPIQNDLPVISIEALVYLNGAGESSNGRFFSKGATTRQSLFYQTAAFAQNNFLGAFSTFSVLAGSWGTPGETFTIPGYYHCIYTHAVATAAAVPNFWLNGKKQITSNNQSSVGTIQADTAALYLGSQATSARDWDGNIVYARMWNRLLNDQEAIKLHQNPWRFYKKPLAFNPTLSTGAPAAAGYVDVDQAQYTNRSPQELINILAGYNPLTGNSMQETIAIALGVQPRTGKSVQELLAQAYGILPATSQAPNQMLYNRLVALGVTFPSPWSSYSLQQLLDKAVAQSFTLAQILNQ